MKTMMRTFLAGALGLTLAVTAGCDNPVDGDGSHATGVAIYSGGLQVASYTHAGRVSTGVVTVDRGSTTNLQVRLLSSAGGQIDLDGIEYSMREPTVLLGTVASASQSSTGEITVTGRQVGTTTLQIPIHHGGHLEFDAQINVVVR